MLNRFRIRTRAFTLLELLIVIAIIISMLALGAMAYSQIMRSTAARMSGALIGDAMRLARQHSVNRRVPVIVEFVDSDELAVYPNEGDRDKVRVIPFKRIRDNTTGGLSYVIQAQAIKEFVLSDNIKYMVLPDKDSLDADMDEDDEKDASQVDKIFIRFNPDGTSSAATPYQDIIDGDPLGKKNMVIFEDTRTPSTERERGLLYIAPTTGFIKERYYTVDTTAP